MTFISSSIQCLNHINEKLEEINGDCMQKYERYQLLFHLFLCKCVSNPLLLLVTTRTSITFTITMQNKESHAPPPQNTSTSRKQETK